jgi:hypothetical protein
MKRIRRFFTEYLFLNLFIFCNVGILSFFVLNFSFFDPFTEAFKDFTLTDLYYSKIKNRNYIYDGPVVLINVENRSREELSFLLQRIEEGKPRVVGLDVIFRDRQADADSLLRNALKALSMPVVYGYVADFDSAAGAIKSHSYFTGPEQGYVNLQGHDKENTTVRYYYPVFQKQRAFTTALLHEYDAGLLQKGEWAKEKPHEIHYWGNLANFRYHNFEEIMNPLFDLSQFQDKILILGYLGSGLGRNASRLDEDKLFTPLNEQLSGRSYPDMYGSVIHANILRMIFDKDLIKVVPFWRVLFVSFIIVWFFLPVMCGLFFKGDVWFNAVGTAIQLLGSILVVFLSVLLYRYTNTKFDPGLLTTVLVLLPTFINLYEAFLLFLKEKLKLPIQSRFLTQEH